MTIELKKFGAILISRQTGKEAFLAFQPVLRSIGKDELIEVDFNGVITFSPSWGDEFLTPLLDIYREKLILKNTGNPSVKATIEILQKSTGKNFNIID